MCVRACFYVLYFIIIIRCIKYVRDWWRRRLRDGGKEVVRVRRPFRARLCRAVTGVGGCGDSTTTPVKGIGHICAGQQINTRARAHLDMDTLNRYTRVYIIIRNYRNRRGYYYYYYVLYIIIFTIIIILYAALGSFLEDDAAPGRRLRYRCSYLHTRRPRPGGV